MSFPDLRELLPQRGEMRLLSRVLEHAESHTRCELEPAASGLFADGDGNLPGFVALEWMAQCAAAHGALRARARGSRPIPGLLLRARDVRLERALFRGEAALEVEARPVGASGPLVRFACQVTAAGGGAPLASGLLSVSLRPDLETPAREASG